MFKAAQVRQDFADAIRNQDEALYKKAASGLKPYIRTQTFEHSLSPSIFAKRTVKPEELLTNREEDDTYYIEGEVETFSGMGVTLNFGDKPEEIELRTKRYDIPIGFHATPIRKKNENELLGKRYDIFKDQGDKDAFALDWLRDDRTVRLLDAAVKLSGREAFVYHHAGTTETYKTFSEIGAGTYGLDGLNYGTKDNASYTDAVRPDHSYFVEAMHLIISGGRTGAPSEHTLVPRKMIFNASVFEDLSLQSRDVIGDELKSKTVINGWEDEKIANRKFISSTKMQIFTQRREIINASTGAGTGKYAWFDVVYILTDPEYLGEYVEVTGQGIQTEMNRVPFVGELQMMSKEMVGMAIGNANGVAKINLFRGIEAGGEAHGTYSISKDVSYLGKEDIIVASGYNN